MQIRKAIPADADAIYRFICLLEEKQMDRSGFDVCFQHNLGSLDVHYLVAEEGDLVIGFLSCQGQMLLHHGGRVYEIQEMYVEEEWRSKDVGRRLLDALNAILSNIDYDVLEVSSNKSRLRAHGFYLQNGFEQTSLKFVKKKDTAQ
jgi:PhnO protein